MKTPLVSDKMNKALNELIQRLFWGNRLLDRQMSVLSVKFVMNKTSATLHSMLAHAFPVLADMVSDYQDERNMLTEYLVTPTSKDDYKDPLILFQTFLDYVIKLESLIVDTIKIAESENDRMTKIFLEKFMLVINNYTAQAILLVDKADQYAGCWMDFDRDIENFIIVEKLQAK